MTQAATTHDRARFIGSSDAGAIVGIDPYRTPLDVWRVKTGRAPAWVPTAKEAARLRRGQILEPYAADMAVDKLRELGHDVEVVSANERVFDPTFPFLTAEIDRVFRIDGIETNVEIKTTSGYLRHQWGEEGTDDIALRYAAQPVHALGISGRARCLVAPLIGLDDIALFWVERDEEVISALRQREVDFWHDFIEADVPPPAVTLEDVKAQHPVDNGRPIEATPDIAKAVARMSELSEQRRANRKEYEALQLRIADYMGPASSLMFKGRRLITFREAQHHVFDLEAFKEEEPSLHADYTIKRSVRTLLLSKLKGRL